MDLPEVCVQPSGETQTDETRGRPGFGPVAWAPERNTCINKYTLILPVAFTPVLGGVAHFFFIMAFSRMSP